MNILYILTKKESEEISVISQESITNNLTKEDCFEIINVEEEEELKQLHYKLSNSIDKKKLKKIDYICILPNNSYLENNYREIIIEYVDIKNTSNKIYLPLSLLITKDSTRGLINTSVWNGQTVEVGMLDNDLALMQTDTILFGALISKELFFDETNYNNELKYYQHYYMLNTITYKDENEVIGIPKMIVNIDYDLAYNSVSREEKIKYYKMAREIKKETMNVEN